MENTASYRALHESGEVRRRAERLWSRFLACDLCPNDCRVNRHSGDKGFCRVSEDLIISSSGPHFGEEPELVGQQGSGTIFFSGCNLHCLFCQNYSISQCLEGSPCTAESLARLMLQLQNMGCANINLVSPTPWVPHILKSLDRAVGDGLHLPLVYNTGGYDRVDILKELDGIVDIYMPDMKYSEEGTGVELSGVRDYPEVNRAAVAEMHRQVGDLQTDEEGVACRGLLIRHLILPGHLDESHKIFKFIARELSPNTYVHIMAQYHPCYKAYGIPGMDSSLTMQEYRRAIELAHSAGLKNVH